MCADLASVMPTEMGLNLPLEQMVQGPLEVTPTPELEMEEREVELSVLESESERVEDSEAEMGLDSRIEYWEWAHDWEDLDWSEEIWMEDERVSSDLNEAVLPDELWE